MSLFLQGDLLVVFGFAKTKDQPEDIWQEEQTNGKSTAFAKSFGSANGIHNFYNQEQDRLDTNSQDNHWAQLSLGGDFLCGVASRNH